MAATWLPGQDVLYLRMQITCMAWYLLAQHTRPPCIVLQQRVVDFPPNAEPSFSNTGAEEARVPKREILKFACELTSNGIAEVSFRLLCRAQSMGPELFFCTVGWRRKKKCERNHLGLPQ